MNNQGRTLLPGHTRPGVITLGAGAAISAPQAPGVPTQRSKYPRNPEGPLPPPLPGQASNTAVRQRQHGRQPKIHGDCVSREKYAEKQKKWIDSGSPTKGRLYRWLARHKPCAGTK